MKFDVWRRNGVQPLVCIALFCCGPLLASAQTAANLSADSAFAVIATPSYQANLSANAGSTPSSAGGSAVRGQAMRQFSSTTSRSVGTNSNFNQSYTGLINQALIAKPTVQRSLAGSMSSNADWNVTTTSKSSSKGFATPTTGGGVSHSGFGLGSYGANGTSTGFGMTSSFSSGSLVGGGSSLSSQKQGYGLSNGIRNESRTSRGLEGGAKGRHSTYPLAGPKKSRFDKFEHGGRFSQSDR